MQVEAVTSFECGRRKRILRDLEEDFNWEDRYPTSPNFVVLGEEGRTSVSVANIHPDAIGLASCSSIVGVHNVLNHAYSSVNQTQALGNVTCVMTTFASTDKRQFALQPHQMVTRHIPGVAGVFSFDENDWMVGFSRASCGCDSGRLCCYRRGA